jgi:iron complex outermembrane recepter protein
MTKNNQQPRTNTAGRFPRSKLMASAAFLAVSAVSTPAFAQAEADDVDEVNIITVIARNNAETLQEVPVAVTVLSSTGLAQYQVNEMADVVSRVPALNVQVGGSGAGGQITLRGIGSTNISAAFDSAVAFNFDGVSVSTQRMVQAAFFDVEQIEVLKGPQSLYFGKSASAGVFSIRSANPSRSWTAGGTASYEFEEKGKTFGGYVSGPLTETIGIRLAGQYQDIEKFVELDAGVPSVFANSGKGMKNTVARLTLQFDDPTDRFSANLKLNYNHNDSETLLGHSDINCGPNGIADPVFLLGGAIQFPSSASCNINDNLYPTGDTHAGIRVILPGTTGANRFTGQSYNETKTFFARLAMDLKLNDALTLSSISGYVRLNNEHLDNFDYAGRRVVAGVILPAGLAAPFSDKLRQYTQEVRVASDYDGPFNFQLGAFFEDRYMPLATSQNALAIALAAGPSAGTGSTFDWYAERNTKAEALSLFASASFDITEQLELSGGIRWTDEKKTATVAFPYVHSALAATVFSIPSGFFAGGLTFKDSNWSPEVTLKYKASDDINIYAAYKTGFKSGGIDNSALPTGSLGGLNSPDPAVRAATAAGLIYKSETAKGGEIGVKAQFADRSVTINAVVYHYKYKDLQVQNFDPIAIQFQTTNASSVKNQGAEIDWSWRTPLDGLSFAGSIGYTDTKFTELYLALGRDLNGRAASRAPKWSGNIGFDYDVELGSALKFGLGSNMYFTSKYFAGNGATVFSGAGSNAAYVQTSYQTFDARASIGHPEDKWKLSLVGVNLGDKIWKNTAGGRPFLSATGDDVVNTQNRGRQLFVEASFKF